MRCFRTTCLAAVVAAGLCVRPALLRARDVRVTSAQQLLDAIRAAAPGDVIELAPGTYRLRGVTCDRPGAEGAPITVRAATPLAARVELDAVEGFHVTAAHWRFEGLDVRGVCANDSSCEHAFHVTGAAHGFVLRNSRVLDFNAQLKVNAARVGAAMVMPDNGLVEGNELADTRARNTGNPTTKLNIDGGDDWVVRANYIHDFRKGGGDGISYGAFMKSGGRRGVFERNLVICTTGVIAGGTRIGLSLGGGGTGAQYCAPAFDPSVPCAVEHSDGLLRNNVIASCSDVGIYLNRARNTRVLHNTLIATAGVDFRFATTTGAAAGNVLGGRIRMRDGGTFTGSNNLENVADATFTAMYQAPLRGDLRRRGDLATLLARAPAHADVRDDYCARPRAGAMLTLGALEHSLGDCDTTRPPLGAPAPPADAGNAPVDAARPDASDAAAPNDVNAPATDAAPTPDAPVEEMAVGAPRDAGGCACGVATRTSDRWGVMVVLLVVAAALARRARAHDAARGHRERLAPLEGA